MSLTYTQATEEIYFQLFNVWRTETIAIVGSPIPELLFPGVEKNTKLDLTKYWARVSTKTVLTGQTSLQNSVTVPGNRRYTDRGLIFVQIFAPKSANKAMERLKLLAQLARSAYRGKTSQGGVVFSNVKIIEIPEEDEFYRLNVVAEFEYDEIS